MSIFDKLCGGEKFIFELNFVVENKFCRFFRKLYSFVLNKDIKFKFNLVIENDIFRFEIRKLLCDILFEIDIFRFKLRRSVLENDLKMIRRMYKRDREFFRIRKVKLCRVM